jgi:tetratricopeptide (TPR) repeat protein
MTRAGELPSGFLGPVRAWASLAPPVGAGARVLELPRQRESWRAAGAGSFERIEVHAWTESLGRIETTLPELAERLADGGTLLLDVDDVQCARLLRQVLEGRPGQFDPAGDVADPTVFLPLRRVLAAARTARLWVHDVVAVPPAAEEFPAGLGPALLANGIAALEWLHGAPPPRRWLVCEKRPLFAGSVLLAGGDGAARQRTERALRAFLPGSWEIVGGDAARECAQWNRAIAAARGELVWFLRAGTEPGAELFAALCRRAELGPAAPATAGTRTPAGDVCGLMLPRTDALLAGPLPEHVANTRVAVEEHTMLLEARLAPVQLVEGTFVCPPAPVEAPAQLAADTNALLARWAAIEPPAAANGTGAAGAPPSASVDVPWHGREPRVSLCMIARDEERLLPECLARARDAVDEIVLVDTGSKDRTVAIAEGSGARVLHVPWDDDFSAPRNAGLSAATGDWVLVLDADEFLQPGAAARIRELVRARRVLGYHLQFVNVYGDGKTLGVMMVRLFRNLPGIAYENVIHEQVTPSLQRLGAPLGLSLASAPVEVEHHGYTDAMMSSRGKNERNERLFRKQLAATPDDLYCHYKYGDFLRRVPGRGADARVLLDRCLELILASPPSAPRALPYAGEVAALCALEAARAGDTERAHAVVGTALRRFVPTPNLHYLAASLALASGRADEAVHHYQRCLAYRDQVLVVPIQEGITGHVSVAGIAQAFMLRGELDRALPLLEHVVATVPAYEVAHLALSRLWLFRGDAARALAVLTAFVAAHPDSPGACQQITLILRQLGQTAAAKRMGERAVRLLEERALDHEAAAMSRLLAAM